MKQRTRLTVAVLLVGAFMAGLDQFIVNLAFPALVADFGGASINGLSWVLNAYAIVFAALLVPAGRWADEFGARRVFLVGLGLFTAASAACAAAGSPGLLVAVRGVQAVGAALMMPTSLALLLGLFGVERRSLVVAGWAAVGAVAAAAGPPLGGVLVQADWRWIFLVNVPVGVLALVGGALLLPGDRRARVAGAGPDTVGAAGFAVAVAALVAGIVQGPEWGWGDPRVLLAFAAAVVLGAVVAARCRRHPVPVIDPALLRVRSFAVATGAATVFFAGFAAMLLCGVLFLTRVWGEDSLHAGLQIAPGPAMAALTAVPGARLAARVGMARVGAVGAALFALGVLWWLVAVSDDGTYAVQFLPGMVITGIGVGCVLPTVTGAAVAGLALDRLATGSAVVTTARQIGSALGVAVAIALLGAPTDAAAFDPVWAFIAVAGLVAVAALAALGRIVPAAAPAAAPAAEVAT